MDEIEFEDDEEEMEEYNRSVGMPKKSKNSSDQKKGESRASSTSSPYVPILDEDGDAIIYFEDEEVIDGKVVEKRQALGWFLGQIREMAQGLRQ